MNYIGINENHHASSCVIEEDGTIHFLEEERISRIKYDQVPTFSFNEVMIDVGKIDENDNEYYVSNVSLLGGDAQKYPLYKFSKIDINDPYFIQNYRVKVTDLGDCHHNTHAVGAMSRSNFSDALIVVTDGMGSSVISSDNLKFHEYQSIYNVNEKGDVDVLEKKYTLSKFYSSKDKNIKQPTPVINYDNETKYHYSMGVGIARLFESAAVKLGMTLNDSGKLMGLAPYGNAKNKKINFFLEDNETVDISLIRYDPENNKKHFVCHESLDWDIIHSSWLNDKKKYEQRFADFAYQIQAQTQEYLYETIKKYLEKTKKTNVIITGGYGLNCVANYFIRKKLDEDFGFGKIKLFADPLSNDAGNSHGAAVNHLYDKTKKFRIANFNTLYLGPKRQYVIEEVLKHEGVSYKSVTSTDVAKLIADRNIVALFQGRSEAGPRALGNRSILYDPTDPNGRDHVNSVKRREWFRPFAGSILHEHMNEWFDMASLDESPFMMYAVDVLPEKVKEIPAITHVDDTCRVQTVKHNQNKYYYELIEEFYKLTGVPILFNTSFNLAGDPLVETLDDAILTLKNSDIEYMYMPELGKLIEVKNE